MVKPQNTNLHNELYYSFNKDDTYLNISAAVYEDIRKSGNTRYEYITPNILFGKSFFSQKFGAVDFKSNAFYKNYDVNKTHFIPNIIYREYGINSNRGGNFRVMTCRNHFKQPDKNYLLYFTEWLMIVNSYRKAGIQLPVGLLSCTKLLISYDKYNNKLYSKCSWCEKNRPIKKYVYKHVYITMCKKCYLSPKKRTPMKQM